MVSVLFKELHIRGIKILDIGYITSIYFILGMIFAKIFDKIYGKFDEKEEETKSLLHKTIEVIGLMWISGIVIYIVKNLAELIPSPFDGLYRFEHSRVKELKNAVVFSFIFLYFQSYFKEKIQYYYNNLQML